MICFSKTYFLKKDWKKTNNLEGYQVRMIRTRSGFWLVFFWLALDSHAKDQILYDQLEIGQN